MDDWNTEEPQIYMPTEAATAVSPDGRKLVFFTVPQLELLIKRVLAHRPSEYTYRWAFHPQQRIHVLLFGWPGGQSAGVAIPEGAGDTILTHMHGTTDLFITVEPVQEQLKGDVEAAAVERIIRKNTLYLPEVHFEPEG